MSRECFECGAPATCEHHVIPRSLGGTKTVPLCGSCHSRAHGLPGETWGSHSALTSAALAGMKARGLYTGGTPPYGYRVDSDGRLVPDHDEMETILEAQRLRQSGLSLRQIAKALIDSGRPPRPKQVWSAKSVSRLTQWSVSAVDRMVKIDISKFSAEQ